MLIVISPAKTLDFENAIVVKQNSFPEFINEAEYLVSKLKDYSTDELMLLMSISNKLASLNELRFKQWQKQPPLEIAKQAVCAFKGDVYTGLNVSDWNDNDFNFAQNNLLILSGLYGVLRPLDYISAYRLEMGSKLQTDKGDNLYKYWGNKISDSINKQLDTQKDSTLINLASNEYFKSVKSKHINAEIITPIFKDFKNDNYKIISFYAKKARGMMSRFIIKNQLTKPEQIKEFTDGGYSYNDRLTKGNEWVFTRD